MATAVAITGNTYPVKDALKALGARWSPDQKAWMVAQDKADQARKIVAASVVVPRKFPTSYTPHKCVVCGHVPQRNSRGYYDTVIYKSGECRDCYEERKMGY